ncbi:hypothetical protein ACRAWG_16350 [Methylobacterium sp. P31]
MADKPDDFVPDALVPADPEAVIARGRELTVQADRLRRAADRQIEEVQATIEEAESVLKHTAHLLQDGDNQ